MAKYNVTGSYNLSRDIKILQGKKEEKLEPVRRPTPAKVFSVNGSINVANKAGYIWIHEYGSDESPAQALAGGITVLEGDWVTVIKEPKEPYPWQVIGYYMGNLSPLTYNLVTTHLASAHATNHQMPTETTVGVDPVLTYQPALQMLKTTGNGSTLIISVQSYRYQYGGISKFFTGSTLDLTSSVPGSGLSRNVLIYLNETTNTLTTLEGTTVVSGGPFAPPIPALPIHGRPSAAVQLTNGQTAITTATHITDVRDFLGLDTGIFMQIPTPTGASQILMADDTLQWIAVYPLVDEDGNIVTSEAKIVYGS